MKCVNPLHNVPAPTIRETVVVVFVFVKLDMYQSTTPAIKVNKNNVKYNQYFRTI